MKRILVIGIIILNMSILAQSGMALVQDPTPLPTQQLSCLDPWVKGDNIAAHKNGGTVSVYANCDDDGIEKNRVIDENLQSFVLMNAPACGWDSIIVIDFKGNYHNIYEVGVKLFHQSYNDPGYVKISLHVKDGDNEKWETIYETENVANAQTLNLKLSDSVYLKNADKIEIFTSGGNFRKWRAYEVQVYEAVRGPKATFLCPDETLPINTVYFLNKPVFQIPILFPCSILIKSQLYVNFKADLLVKYIGVSRDNTKIYEKSFSLDTAKSEMEKSFHVADGAATYTVCVKDFGGNSKTYILNLIGIQNGPAFVLSKPMGPSSGKTKNTYTYSVNAIDVENDPIEVGWDWNGDGSVDQWTSSNSASHSWSKPGEYNIIVSVREANSGRLGLWTVSKTINIEKDGSSPSVDLSQSSAITTSVTSTTTTTTSTSSETSSISASTSGTILKTNTLLR